MKTNNVTSNNKLDFNVPPQDQVIDLSKKNRYDVLPWIEKYRPPSFDEIISHKTVIDVLRKTIKDNRLQHLLFHGPSGTGKCLDLTTPVMMYNGLIKQAQYIKTGDLLMGNDNTPRRVLSTTTGEDDMYHVIQNKGDDYVVNSEHLISLKLSSPFQKKWLEKENRYKLIWLENHTLKQKSFTVQMKNKRKYKYNFKSNEDAYTALKNYKQHLIDNNIANKKGDICDISIKDYLRKQVDWKNVYKGFKCGRITCWQKQEVDLDPYLLGYWLGDGDRYKAHITTADPEIVTEFTEKAKAVGLNLRQGNNTEKYKGEYQYFITTGICIDKDNNKWSNNNNYENYFYKCLKKYNLIDNKHVPDDYKYNGVDTRLQLLAGFLDADAHLNKSNNFEFCQKSKKLYDDIVFIARSLGLIASVVKSKIIDGVEYYRSNIYGKGIEDIPVKIPRKESDEYRHYKDPLVYEIQIEKLPKGKYCGFELDDNGRFLLGDFTVTHNTSMIMSCARELYGDKMDLMTLNINASEERGIEVVRGRIQEFVNAKIIHCGSNNSMFKLVILDEADAMTADAQAMLRKVIENYSYCTRFCLICNYIKKITPALQSRCACYRFPPLKPEDIKIKILSVAELENINITEDGIDTIINRSKGDMRRVLNILQSTSMSYGVITGAVVNKCIGYPNSIDIKKIIDSLVNDNFQTSYKIISEIKTKDSYSLQDIITEITSELILITVNPKLNKYNNLDPFRIISIIKLLSQIEHNLTTCVTESLQLSALVGAFKLSKV